MWLANANSAVNVFIYSSTNKQFRRECVLLASRLCCSRRSCLWQSKWCLMEAPSPSSLHAVPDGPGCFLLGWWIQEVDVLLSPTLWQSKWCWNKAAGLISLLSQTVLSFFDFSVFYWRHGSAVPDCHVSEDINASLNLCRALSVLHLYRRSQQMSFKLRCCSRLSRLAASEHPTYDRHGNVSSSLPPINLSTINVTAARYL